jgi:hypothetical protein
MENDYVNRLRMIIKTKSKSAKVFSQEIGFTYTTLNSYLNYKRKDISNDLSVKIISTFEDINAKWLLIGDGEMLINDKNKNNQEVNGTLSLEFGKEKKEQVFKFMFGGNNIEILNK